MAYDPWRPCASIVAETGRHAVLDANGAIVLARHDVFPLLLYRAPGPMHAAHAHRMHDRGAA